MNRLKTFLFGTVLLAIIFVMAILTALVYRANERANIKSYIFQTDNYSSERVGDLQSLNNMSDIDLRNKLIAKYVSEYFKVIPGEQNISDRSIMRNLSTHTALEQWREGEALKIEEMSQKNMFRMVKVKNIALFNTTKSVNYKSESAPKQLYYAVRYDMYTWPESNIMKVEPLRETGTIIIEALFVPGITDSTNNQKIDIKKYLADNNNPVGLFKFRVTNIGTQE